MLFQCSIYLPAGFLHMSTIILLNRNDTVIQYCTIYFAGASLSNWMSEIVRAVFQLHLSELSWDNEPIQ